MGHSDEEDARRRLSDEAIDWLVLLKSGRATDADRRAWQDWRVRSAAHEEAAAEAEALWEGVGIAGTRLRTKERRAKVTRRTVLGGGAAAIAGIGLVQSGVIGPQLFAQHVTAVGERRSVALPDGSTALMNADTALSTEFTATRRGLRLFQGQALFTVASDFERPFVVAAAGGETRAVGTVFEVDIRPSQVAVTVVDGQVEVTAAAGGADRVRADADQRVRYREGALFGGTETVDAALETAWQSGKLIFNRRPLGDVITDIERYREGRILILDPSLRSLEVTGVFAVDEPEAMLATLEATLPVRVTQMPLLTLIR
ncbi:FecR family protein [Mangrovicella endophytica]|uniref:FecR family protein n=1 Tax=Mangrovicella endophytica TaxID=2066697 RepID=UPI000C9E1D29|nr:FecR domain-containing protein [Mangrovicella endophytica]